MAEEGQDIREYMVNKYGPGALRNFGDPDSYLYKSGREVGIIFKSDRNIYPTAMAHALMEHVKDKVDNDKANQLMELMYKSYFELGENINSVSVLTDIATKVLDDETVREGALEAMQNPMLQQHVKSKDLEYKTKLRVSGVPFFIIERASKKRPIAFSGAQPSDIIAEQLEHAAEG